jgi:hypothetical protein
MSETSNVNLTLTRLSRELTMIRDTIPKTHTFAREALDEAAAILQDAATRETT